MSTPYVANDFEEQCHEVPPYEGPSLEEKIQCLKNQIEIEKKQREKLFFEIYGIKSHQMDIMRNRINIENQKITNFLKTKPVV